MLVRPTATAHLARIYEPETRTHDWATRLNVAHPNRLKDSSRESNTRRVPGGASGKGGRGYEPRLRIQGAVNLVKVREGRTPT